MKTSKRTPVKGCRKSAIDVLTSPDIKVTTAMCRTSKKEE